MRRRTLALLLSALCASGCYEAVPVDVFPDAGLDAGTDSGTDAGAEADVFDVQIPHVGRSKEAAGSGCKSVCGGLTPSQLQPSFSKWTTRRSSTR